MELFIDGSAADTDDLTVVYSTFSVASATEPEYGRIGYSKCVSIPVTPLNSELMGDCEQINIRDRFNGKMHEARVEVDGCVVMEGFIRLARCERSETDVRYVFYIIGAAKKWIDYASNTTFSSLFPEYSATISAKWIKDSWTMATPVRWLPVLRNRYEPEAADGTISKPLTILTAHDYHPFVNCRTLLHRIFADAGYTLSSDFIDSTYFDSFYMNGRYTTHEVQTLEKRMDFKAARFGTVSATANQYGIVYANPNTTYSTIGNIVHTANPGENRDGKTINGVFDNGGCFAINGNRISFVPLYSVDAGFEYKLKYVTDYRIKNLTQLTGFDKICLGNGQIVHLLIPNNFQDRRYQFRAGKEFRCIIFNHSSAYTYRLIANKIHSSFSEECTLAQFTSSSVLVSVDDVGTYTNMRVMCMVPGSSSYVLLPGEWALYDGYVAERGDTEVEVAVRSRAEHITPASPKYFDAIYFAGAQSGMKLNLIDATVRPVFQAQPTDGDTVSFYDMGVHNLSCLSVIKSLGEMFGFCYYTDELEKKVYIEPRDMFYRDDVVLDWSDRLDFSKPIQISELSTEVPGRVTWRYRDGDMATAEFNRENDTEFGTLSLDTGNKWREGEEKLFENPLFTTTVNSSGVLATARSASFPNVGNGFTSGDAYGDNLNFTPKIIRYLGMKLLADGEVWGWPSFSASYPLSAFHYPHSLIGITKPASVGGEPADIIEDDVLAGFTLCYEDRDGVRGLHRWRDSLLDTYRDGVRLTAWISLGADEIEAFVRPNYLKHDFRARFRLHIDGEWNDWRLEEICDYTPLASSTKCVFIKII